MREADARDTKLRVKTKKTRWVEVCKKNAKYPAQRGKRMHHIDPQERGSQQISNQYRRAVITANIALRFLRAATAAAHH